MKLAISIHVILGLIAAGCGSVVEGTDAGDEIDSGPAPDSDVGIPDAMEEPDSGGLACVNDDGSCRSGCDYLQDSDCPADVLVVFSTIDPALPDDIQAKLGATGAFRTIDIFDARNTTPTAAELAAYDALLLSADVNWADPVAFGDRVASFFEAGGIVVTGVFGTSSTIGALQGRFGDRALGYVLIDRQPQETPAELTLGNHDPNSPLMRDVETLTFAQAWRGSGDALPGTTVVAEYSDGRPLVVQATVNNASVTDRQLVELNMVLPSNDVLGGMFGFWVGDGAELIRNALLFR